LLGIDESAQKGDLLEAGDLQALSAFHDAHELGGLQQRFMGPGVEPGESAATISARCWCVCPSRAGPASAGQ
jgi:hypothetical protein